MIKLVMILIKFAIYFDLTAVLNPVRYSNFINEINSYNKNISQRSSQKTRI